MAIIYEKWVMIRKCLGTTDLKDKAINLKIDGISLKKVSHCTKARTGNEGGLEV